MTITHYMPTAPTGLSASLADGGSLDANTTYYLVVVAADGEGATRVDLVNTTPIYSPYSAEVSITTTTTKRTINLSWNQVMKPQYPTTEVDGYIVLLSRTQNIANANDIAMIGYYPRGYRYLSTLTNSISITSNPNVLWHNIKNGLPRVIGLGDAPHTLQDLANYYRDYLPNCYTVIGGHHDTAIGYLFYGLIKFNNYSPGTTFTASQKHMIVLGGFDIYGTIIFDRITGQFLCDYLSTALGNISSTSVIKDCVFYSYNYSTYAGARIWLGCRLLSNVTNLFSNCAFELTTSVSIQPSSNVSNKSFTCLYPRGSVIGYPSYFDKDIIDCLRNGGVIYNFSENSMMHLCPPYHFMPGVRNLSVDLQTSIPHLIDCYYEWNNDSLYGTTSGFLPKINIYAQNANSSIKNYVLSFWRSIRVFVKDERGNPVPNARVSFWSISRGTNLTHGNSSDQMVGQRPDSQDTTNNWDNNDIIFKHDAEYLWLRDWNNNKGTNAPRYITVGNTYWMQCGKVKIVQQLPDTPYRTGVTKFSVQRGVDNTLPQWQYLYNPYYTGCFFAQIGRAHV